MGIQVESLDQGRIVVISHPSDFDLEKNAAAVVQEQLAQLEAATGRLVFILDMRGIAISLEGLIQAANQMRTETGQRMMHHHNFLDSIIVTNNRAAALAAKGLNSAAFGHIVAPIFETVEEALGYAQRRLDEATSR